MDIPNLVLEGKVAVVTGGKRGMGRLLEQAWWVPKSPL